MGKVKANAEKLLSWSELPGWMRDNGFILTGYRQPQWSWSGCFKSVFGYLHNETVNIHSHLWGAVLFVGLLWNTFNDAMRADETVAFLDYLVIAIFQFGAVFCMSASALLHTASCHSPGVQSRCHLLDYTGIIVLICSSFIPSVYYGFYCEPTSQLVHLPAMALAGAAAAYTVLAPKYSRPEYRSARATAFVALGLCAIVPVSHGLYTEGYYQLCVSMGLPWLVLSGALYILGAVIYANRVPERLAPGRFDYFMSSHQIFHFHVVAAALAHQKSLMTAFTHWHAMMGGSCTPRA